MEFCKAVLFDLDGTLLDTLADLTDSVNAALRRFGYPEHSTQRVREMVGNGIALLVQRAVPPQTSDEAVQQVYECLLKVYQAHCAERTRPYPGIVALLTRLRARGTAIAIVSNKADAAVQQLREIYFPGLITTALGQTPARRTKPAPDMCLAVLQTLRCPVGQALYVGDSEVDVATAKNAGLRSILVDWGFRSRTQLREAGAQTVVSSPEELLRQIECSTESDGRT